MIFVVFLQIKKYNEMSKKFAGGTSHELDDYIYMFWRVRITYTANSKNSSIL
ncbi:hypothetical protein LMQOC2_20818 [Listeria monocytogenes QOC2]|nr:hypothetical protein LMQOC2_20818 [Listeria monocytogenes QOC2]CUL87543.1 hypothetical protein LM83088_90625 [Listeria monocytogenes]